MRDVKRMKGFWRTVESVFAVILIMGFLVTAGSVYFSSTAGNGPAPGGYEKLKELDDRNDLRPLAAARDFEAVNSMIDVPGYSHSIMICDFGGGCWGNSTESQTGSMNVMVSSYIISGHGSYEPLEIRLYMWR